MVRQATETRCGRWHRVGQDRTLPSPCSLGRVLARLGQCPAAEALEPEGAPGGTDHKSQSESPASPFAFPCARSSATHPATPGERLILGTLQLELQGLALGARP